MSVLLNKMFCFKEFNRYLLTAIISMAVVITTACSSKNQKQDVADNSSQTERSDEYGVIDMPPPVSYEKTKDINVVNILVTSQENDRYGKIFLSIYGDSLLPSKSLRLFVLDEALDIYNKDGEGRNKPLSLTPKQKEAFADIDFFGSSFENMGEVLNMDFRSYEELLNDLHNDKVGIPISKNESSGNLNDFQVWMMAIKSVAEKIKDNDTSDSSDNFYNSIMSGQGISIKASPETPFPVINTIFENLKSVRLNKFSIMSAIKNDDL